MSGSKFLNQYLTIEFYYDLSKFKTIVKINKMFYSYQLLRQTFIVTFKRILYINQIFYYIF